MDFPGTTYRTVTEAGLQCQIKRVRQFGKTVQFGRIGGGV